MMNRSIFPMLLSLGLLAGPAAAQEPVRVLRLCVDETPQFPWRLPPKDRQTAPQGLDYLLLELAAQRIGLKVEFTPLPWRRCLSELPRGLHDGLLAASFRPERLELGVYPMRQDQPDESLRMRRESYSLYKLASQPLGWDGKAISVPPDQPPPVLGAQSGYSIVEQLRGLGFKVDEGTRSADSNLDKLLKGRVQAVALLTGDGDDALRRESRWARAVQRLDPPLVEKSYFLIYSRAFFSANESLARQLWSELAAARESAAFRKAEAELLKRR